MKAQKKKKNTLLKYFSPTASDKKESSKGKAKFKRKALQDLAHRSNNHNSVITATTSSQKKTPATVNIGGKKKLAVGTLVNVQKRTWIGINKPGGVARIVAIDDEAKQLFHVKYIFGGSEKGVAVNYISLYEDLKDDTCRRAKRVKRETKLSGDGLENKLDGSSSRSTATTASVREQKNANVSTSRRERVTHSALIPVMNTSKKEVAVMVVPKLVKSKVSSKKKAVGASATRKRIDMTETHQQHHASNSSSKEHNNASSRRKIERQEKVFARFTDTKWYWGTIVRSTKTGSDIQFDDGDVRKNVPTNDILTKDQMEGERRVYAKFTDGHWYWGTLLSKNKAGTLCNICFDDGDVRDGVPLLSDVLTKIEVQTRAASLSQTKNVGDRIYAEYSPGAWFWGVVASIQGRTGLIHVLYDDGDERRGVSHEAYQRKHILPPPLDKTSKRIINASAHAIGADTLLSSKSTSDILLEKAIIEEESSSEVLGAQALSCKTAQTTRTSDERPTDTVSLKGSSNSSESESCSSVSTPTTSSARKKLSAKHDYVEHCSLSPTTIVTNNFIPDISLKHPGKINTYEVKKFSNLNEELVHIPSDKVSEMHPSLANTLHRSLMSSEPQTGYHLLINQLMTNTCIPPREDLKMMLRSIMHGTQNEGIELSDTNKQQMIADYAMHPLVIKQISSCWQWECYADIVQAPLHSKQTSVWNRTSCALEYVARLFSEPDGILVSCDNPRQTLRQTNAVLATFFQQHGDEMLRPCSDSSRVEHILAITRLVKAFGGLSVELAAYISEQEHLCKKDMTYLCLGGHGGDDALSIILEDMLVARSIATRKICAEGTCRLRRAEATS
eukprot:CAMPEP_0116010130 /NCGR_PEP_ID=MMETSP0321-20121206/3826_1 /TAXON_ID=163516 /ORGANISM="Leptocylindrus danicus var. danicus, Strain B650" /LENGTH=842 /DNA_ID=CAMNT_0003479187 /DNA_START=42 /DNA_END=2570 /DNA_ORIENTATION=+